MRIIPAKDEGGGGETGHGLENKTTFFWVF